MYAALARILIVIIAWSALPALAADWTRADTQRELLFVVPAIVDWGQTRHIATHPERFVETNRQLGPHPSVADVDRYFPGYLAQHLVIAWALPGRWRQGWQYATAAYQAGLVWHNRRLGIRVAF